ncbi:Heparan-sulfate 6-O-sulfotransferase 1 [Papilio machaon]|uniref:Heparan-sulfate 6-O-sulfotransferase n=1 Tax=Papilio machaon TaxID=76193 RepID=A0A194R8B5_PAPMA|nr:Heparan-sulfate 6-O-sulfotransferase 1 [Papilio machaon]
MEVKEIDETVCALSPRERMSESYALTFAEALGRPLPDLIAQPGLSYDEVLHDDFRFDLDAHDVMVFLHIQKTGGTSFGKHLVMDLDLKFVRAARSLTYVMDLSVASPVILFISNCLDKKFLCVHPLSTTKDVEASFVLLQQYWDVVVTWKCESQTVQLSAGAKAVPLFSAAQQRNMAVFEILNRLEPDPPGRNVHRPIAILLALFVKPLQPRLASLCPCLLIPYFVFGKHIDKRELGTIARMNRASTPRCRRPAFIDDLLIGLFVLLDGNCNGSSSPTRFLSSSIREFLLLLRLTEVESARRDSVATLVRRRSLWE